MNVYVDYVYVKWFNITAYINMYYVAYVENIDMTATRTAVHHALCTMRCGPCGTPPGLCLPAKLCVIDGLRVACEGRDDIDIDIAILRHHHRCEKIVRYFLFIFGVCLVTSGSSHSRGRRRGRVLQSTYLLRASCELREQ